MDTKWYVGEHKSSVGIQTSIGEKAISAFITHKQTVIPMRRRTLTIKSSHTTPCRYGGCGTGLPVRGTRVVALGRRVGTLYKDGDYFLRVAIATNSPTAHARPIAGTACFHFSMSLLCRNEWRTCKKQSNALTTKENLLASNANLRSWGCEQV